MSSPQMQQSTIIEYISPSLLKAHPRNTAIYGDDGYSDLIPSITELGVLQALYCKRDRTVVSGHRRWKAALEAQCSVVPVIWVSYPTELDERQAIIEFNRYRIKNGQQLYNEGCEIEAIEKILAQHRQEATQLAGRDKMGQPVLRSSVVESFPPPTDSGKTRDVVASTIGIGSGRQWDKLKYVAEHKPELLASIKSQGISIDSAARKTKAEVVRATAPPEPPLPQGTYDVIYADPPWLYDNQIQDWGPTSLHYPAMELSRLTELVGSRPGQIHPADNAVLFLWATNPFLEDALNLVRAWGFSYKTNIVWVKRDLQRPGSGFYVRGRHELLLICTRGSFVPDQKGKEPIGSVVEAPVREHSRKPDEVYAIIETMYPAGKRLEMFARGVVRDGWESFGNEAKG